MLLNVAELMRDPDMAQPFQVERAGGAFDEGEWIPAAPEIIDMVGIVQPAKREDVVELLPEGTRLADVIVVYCDTALHADDADAQRSDVVVWDDKPHRVIAAKLWAKHGFWQIWAEGFVR